MRNMKREALEGITLEDFDGDLRTIAEVCGIDVAISMMQVSGIHLYVPQTALKRFARKVIVLNARRYNAKELALMCGVSQQFVQDTLKEHYGHQEDSEDSLSLF